MNTRGAWALVRGTWLSWMQYRSFFFLLAFGWMIPPLIYMLVWSAAAGSGEIGGFTRGGFTAYYLVLILVNQITYAQTNWTVGDLIRYGQMNRILLRPLHPLYDAIASELAGKVVYLAFDVPVVAVLALVLQPEWNITWQAGVLFIPCLLLAWALRFFWGYCLALLAFWATRADALLGLQDALIFLLAGQAAPVSLLPGFLQEAAVILPFRYMVAFPVEVLTGQVSGGRLMYGFAMQAIWLLISITVYRIIWKRGLKNYAAVGG